MRYRGITLFTVSVLLLSVTIATATTVPDRSIREITAEAPSIVYGSVVSTASKWTENRSLIVTEVTFRVIDVLKGDPVSQVTVTQPGGTVGKLRVDVAGANAYVPGDEAILFLTRNPRGKDHVVGLFQGRFDVIEDPQGRKLVRGITPEHVEVLGTASARDSGVLQRVRQGRPIPLDDFLGGVRDLIQDISDEGGR